MVFPFGMYTVCAFQLSKALNFPSLMVVPRYFIDLALGGWVAVLFGFLYSVFNLSSRRLIEEPRYTTRPGSSR